MLPVHRTLHPVYPPCPSHTHTHTHSLPCALQKGDAKAPKVKKIKAGTTDATIIQDGEGEEKKVAGLHIKGSTTSAGRISLASEKGGARVSMSLEEQESMTPGITRILYGPRFAPAFFRMLSRGLARPRGCPPPPLLIVGTWWCNTTGMTDRWRATKKGRRVLHRRSRARGFVRVRLSE
jgi:hypothetical protein